MRIVGGVHRGRALAAPGDESVRPTSDRAREALFNLLEQGRVARGGSRLAGAHVLDAFAGAGALALEALSRGADHATAFDVSTAALDLVRANAERLGETKRIDVRQADALAPPPAPRPADLVLLDPPYGQDLALKALAALDAAGWVAADVLIVIETGAGERVDPPAGFMLADERRYGRARLWFLQRG